MKNNLLNRIGVPALALAATAAASAANPKAGMLIGYSSVENENAQESVAAKFFKDKIGGEIITPAQLEKIDASKLDCIWIHIDRVEITKGWENLPQVFNDDAVISALKQFVAEGGNLYLSKYATQLLVPLGRMDAAYAPGIVTENGNGGIGTDVWTVNAHLGYWKGYLAPEEERDLTQVYDRRSHAIYEGMSTWPAHCGLGFSEFETESFPLLGTGDGTEMHREDHNCMWDLNSYQYTAEGRNTVERFEAQNNATVLGTWGHVVDFAVAGIVDFAPAADGEGRIMANGMAAFEWAPRTGINKFHDNLEKFTSNVIDYLTDPLNTGVSVIEAETTLPVYYNLQGVRVDNPSAGLYIKVEGKKASKVVL